MSTLAEMYPPDHSKLQKIESILQNFFQQYDFIIKNCFLLQIRENYEIYRILGDLEGMEIQLQISLPFAENGKESYELNFMF